MDDNLVVNSSFLITVISDEFITINLSFLYKSLFQLNTISNEDKVLTIWYNVLTVLKSYLIIYHK